MSAQDTHKGRAGESIGPDDYRGFVGPAERYDVFSSVQFNLLSSLGLRQHHTLLDIGCGSLRAGRLFIPYLQPGHYFGLEPQDWLIREGIAHEVGEDLIRLKQPVFRNDGDFELTAFGRQFDFILAHSIFSHASQAQIRACLAEARQVMHPDSVFLATYAPGDANYEGDEWVLWATYTPERMRELIEEQDLACLPIDWPHPDPNLQHWIMIVPKESVDRAPRVDDSTRTLQLHTQLEFYRERLSRLEGHPWVRLGMGLNRVLRSLRYRLGRGGRA